MVTSGVSGMLDQPSIPVMKPRLPNHSRLLEYIKRIDESRTYTNFGPLHRELEERLAAHFAVKTDEVLLVTNGTLALQGAVATCPTGDEWLMPSWTFVASAEAVAAAGRDIRFGDVNPATWTLRVETESAHMPHMVVAPFGDSPRLSDVRQIVKSSPVIIDAASCFDSCRGLGSAYLANSMVMVSLHATKLVTTGEGGVLIGDSAWVNDVKRWSNFGFRGRRVADVQGTNAKMSEYAAAVGLASLDEWSSTRAQLSAVFDRYRSNLDALGIALQPSLAHGHLTSTAVASFVDGHAMEAARAALHRNGIESRAWWSQGVHRMPSFAGCATREPLVSTDQLALTTLGLPFFVDMSSEQIDRVVEVLSGARV
jgi:dTDP-4-amino-4,6-dideoxygalactose transaminase